MTISISILILAKKYSLGYGVIVDKMTRDGFVNNTFKTWG